MSLAASHSRGKFATDRIFGASGAAAKATAQHGPANVINATIGAFMDDQERLACLPTVEKVLREMPITEIINYAPIAGLPDYLKAVVELTFREHRPEAYVDAIATAGGSGVIHNTIWNYSEIGDTILTSDWYWDPYKILSDDALRKLDTFTLFDEQQNFNIQAFAEKVTSIMTRQDGLLIILNTPAHNPTGYSITDDEWDNVLQVIKDQLKNPDKRITLLVDIAYLDYAGDSSTSRAFLKKFSNLPANFLAILAFSMSKSFTMYGQRTGAMIGIASDKAVIDEFTNANLLTCRATWSNINRGAMGLLATIYKDKALLAQVEQERSGFYHFIKERADIFMQEAKAADLHMLPYRAGFFLTIPAHDSDAVCTKLHDDLIFAVPLAKGVRIAVCAVTPAKITGMALKVKKALEACDQLVDL